jgi:hypothetical protein
MELEEIPQNIKNSLLNERVDEILDDIREEAGIFDESLLPSIYYGLISKEIPAHYFVESLSETGIGEKIAKSVARAIKERILEAERFPLFKWGIDISEIKVEDAPPLETLGLKEFLNTESFSKTFSLEDKESVEEEIPIIREAPKTSFIKPSILESTAKEEKKENAPFILEKKETIKEPQQKTFSSLSLGQIGFFKLKRGTKDENSETITKTIKAEVKIPEETKKVIHYSENKTTLNLGNDFLKKSVDEEKKEELQEKIEEKIISPYPQKENEKEDLNKKEEDKNNNYVKIEEEKNIIDLRNTK